MAPLQTLEGERAPVGTLWHVCRVGRYESIESLLNKEQIERIVFSLLFMPSADLNSCGSTYQFWVVQYGLSAQRVQPVLPRVPGAVGGNTAKAGR